MSSPLGSASGLQPVGVKRQKAVVPDETSVLLRLLQKYMQEVEVYLDIDLSRDLAYVTKRTEKEGLGFLAKTLPQYLKWVRRCQQNSSFGPCPGFKTIKAKRWSKPFPSFLSGLLGFLADDAGFVIYEVEPLRVERQRFAYCAISTICQTFGAKYEYPLSEEVKNAQIRETFRFDQEDTFDLDDLMTFLDGKNAPILDIVKAELTSVFEPYIHVGTYEDDEGNTLWGEHEHVFNAFEYAPRHGAGAVSYPCKPHEKYTHFMGLPPHFSALGEFEDLLYLDGEATAFGKAYAPDRKERYDLAIGGVGRFELVPKNAEKGRGIGLEMKEFMFPQQSLRESIYRWCETCPRTKGHVNFTDQTVNQELALKASSDGTLVTVDVTNASDSVTRTHVDNSFGVEMLELLNSLRSRFTRATVRKTNDSGVEEIEEVLFAENKKYAAMGSALCFPVEALFFWAVTRAVIRHVCSGNALLDSDDYRKVWIYGDDLIFPTVYYDRVVEVFDELCVKINVNKSFSSGLFRESCGVDAYNGVDVTPVCRLSTRLPFRNLHTTDSDHARSIVAWIEYANLFERDGFPAVARSIRQTVCTQYPSAKSIPRLKEEYSVGGLFWLDYDGWTVEEYLKRMRSEQDKQAYFVCTRSTLDTSYVPVEDDVAPVHVVTPFYQGVYDRSWSQSISSYRADITENVRRLRYYSEGSEGTEASYWFPDKSSFCLRRKTNLFS